MSKMFFKGFMFFFIVFFVLSCNSELQEKINENKTQGSVRLKVNTTEKDTNSRIIFAQDYDFTEYRFELTGKMQGKWWEEHIFPYKSTSYSLSYSELLSSEFLLNIGTWEYITLAGYTAYGDPITMYATLSNVEIVKGTNELLFELKETPDSYGNFEVTLHFPEDSDVGKVSIEIFNLDGSPFDDDNPYGDYVYLLDSEYSVMCNTTYAMPVGMYILSFKFFRRSDATEIKPGYSELVQIKASLTSTAERTITNLEKLHSITYNLNGGEFSGYSIPASFIEQETFVLPTEESLSKMGRGYYQEYSYNQGWHNVYYDKEYDFDGWYESEVFSEDAITEIKCGTRNDITLYAKWKPRSYNITYEGVDEAENNNPKTYTFENYSTKFIPPAGSNVFREWWLNGKSVTSIPIGTVGNIVLVAKWETVIEQNADDAIESLAQMLSDDDFFNIILTGNLSNEQFSLITKAIKDSGKQVKLDLGNTTGLNKIETNAFSNCKGLESIVIPEGVTTIEANAFKNCTSLNTITVPSTLTKVEAKSFEGCSAITTVNCAGVESWKQIEFGGFGNSYYNLNPLGSNTKAYVNGEDVTSQIYTYNIKYEGVDNKTHNLNPSTYDSREGLKLSKAVKSNVKFGGWTLDENNVAEIKIGTKGDLTITATWLQGLYITASSAASGSLASYLHYTVTGSGPHDVYLTGELKSEYLDEIRKVLRGYPEKLVRIDLSEIADCTETGEYAFADCDSLESLTLPQGLTTISPHTVQNCKNLATIKIPSSVKTLEYCAFEGCDNLENVYLDDLASWCEVEFVIWAVYNYPTNPLSKAKHLFINEKEVKDLVIPNGVTTINPHVFGGVNCIESVTISETVKTISKYSFNGCTELKTVVIGKGVREIGTEAFKGCTKLTKVKFNLAYNWYLNDNDKTVIASVGDESVNASKLRSGEWCDKGLIRK